MRVQISSGQGPAECELAVAMLYEELRKEAGDVRLVGCTPGKKPGCMSSVVFETDRDLRELEGSVQWICKSPYRPGHRRKNWYVDVSILDQVPRISEERMVRFETFCSGGKGGQHVNKVETGVRAIHIPTGTAVVSTQARSQHMNKQIAMNRLCCILAEMNARNQQKEKSLAWMEHARLERGNPVRIYEGMKFERSRKH